MYALDMVIEIEISDLRQNYEKIQSALGLQTSQLKTEGANCFIGTTVLESVLRVGCLELSDLPESIKDSELEDTALRLFKKRNVEIESSSIEDFRRLPSIGPKRVIIKFSKRNEANSIRRVKQT